MSKVAVVATCALNQCALDVRGNVSRIVESVRQAKASGARYRCGPELDITGYGCGDHFLEADTLRQAWEGVAELLQHEVCRTGILVDVGLPVQHNNVVYNCKLVFYNRKVLLIRPKMMLADDSHMGYQETRWFTPWQKARQVERYSLPACVTKVTGQRSAVPFGDALVVTRDATLGYEICEELWNPDHPHIGMSLAGADIICNGSGSLMDLTQPDIAYRLVQDATLSSGGCYLFANLKGCDGSLGYYTGDACIAVSGRMVAAAPLHTLPEVEVVVAAVDLDAINTYRNLIRSRCRGAAASPAYPRVQVNFALCQEEEGEVEEGRRRQRRKEEKEKEEKEKEEEEKEEEEEQLQEDKARMEAKRGHIGLPPSLPMKPHVPTQAEAVLEGAACWLWDFLRRSSRRGLLLAVGGEVPDAATAAVVFAMCCKVMAAAPTDPQVQADLQRVTGGVVPKEAQELCGRLLVTFPPTPHAHDARAAAIAQQIGSDHVTPLMEGDAVMKSIEAAQKVTAAAAAAEGEGGGIGEGSDGEAATHALHHLHAFHARLLALRVAKGEVGRGGARQLLVLATTPAGDAPEAFESTSGSSSRSLRRGGEGGGGHFGDVSVVGHIPRGVLQEVLQLAKERYNLPVLADVLEDERDKRKHNKDEEEDKDEENKEEKEKEEWAEMWGLHRTQYLGPRAMFLSLMHRWRETHSPAQVAERVQAFFRAQGAEGITPPGAPSCYMPGYGPQHPARPFLTRHALTRQFTAINEEVNKLEGQNNED